MPLNRKYPDVTLNNTDNTNIEDLVSIEKLNQKFNEFQQLDNVSLAYYQEVIFTDVINSSTNESNIQNIGGITTDGQYFLLLAQTDTTENGIYKRVSGSNVKQTPTVNTIYYNNSSMGLYNHTVTKYMISYSRRVFLYKLCNFTSNTEQTVYNIPHFILAPITVNLELIGANNGNFSDNISVENTQRFFNNSYSSIISMGDYGSEITRTGTTFSTTPTITYDTTSVSDTITLKILPNAIGFFYVRAVVTF